MGGKHASTKLVILFSFTLLLGLALLADFFWAFSSPYAPYSSVSHLSNTGSIPAVHSPKPDQPGPIPAVRSPKANESGPTAVNPPKTDTRPVAVHPPKDEEQEHCCGDKGQWTRKDHEMQQRKSVDGKSCCSNLTTT